MALIKKSKKEETKNSIKSGVVIVERLNVREQPELTANVVMELKKNQTVEVLGIDKTFYKIANGYVMQQFIKI